MYRIIAVEGDGTLKVIKNESIGNKVFDTRYSNISTDYCYQNSGVESGYFGCKVWESKTTMLDSSGNNITSMPREVGGTLYNLPTIESYINTYLNSTWLNTLSTDIQNKIIAHMFNVGDVSISDSAQTLVTDVSQEQTYKWKGKI